MSVVLSPFKFIFKFIFNLLSLILNFTGRLICGVLGLAFLIIGLILAITWIGAVIGVPIMVFGLMLIARSVF